MSLDEHRVKFKPNLFDKVITQSTQTTDFSYTPMSQVAQKAKRRITSWFGRGVDNLEEKAEERTEKDDKFNKSSKLQDKYTDKAKKTDALEVWFAGCHTGMLPLIVYFPNTEDFAQMLEGDLSSTPLALPWPGSLFVG